MPNIANISSIKNVRNIKNIGNKTFNNGSKSGKNEHKSQMNTSSITNKSTMQNFKKKWAAEKLEAENLRLFKRLISQYFVL